MNMIYDIVIITSWVRMLFCAKIKAYARPGIASSVQSGYLAELELYRSLHQIQSNHLTAHKKNYSFLSQGPTFYKINEISNLVPL